MRLLIPLGALLATATTGCTMPAPDTGQMPPQQAPHVSAPGRSAPAPAPSQASPAARTGAPTRVLDEAALERLRGNSGMTLQWISWDRRGVLHVFEPGGQVRIQGEQVQQDGPGRLVIDGIVTEIGARHFLFDGTIRITDTPDPGRECVKTGPSRFEITQGRSYWRLREFEWCDGLTDYVDIYF